MEPTTQHPSSAADPRSVPAATPSSPSDREIELLRRLLSSTPLEGADTLLDQLRMLHVSPASDPTTRIYLLHPDAPRSSCSSDGRAKVATVPVRVPVGRVVGELSVWVDHGHLCALQYVLHDGRTAMTLPAPEWLDLAPAPAPAPDSIPMPVRVRGAREAILGLRVLRTPGLPKRAPAPTPRSIPAPLANLVRMARWAAFAVAAMVTLVLVTGAFSMGQSGGADLGAARSDGSAAGAADGADDGATLGTFIGNVEGDLAGRNSTQQSAFTTARARAIAVAKRKAAEERAAAAAAAAYTYNTNCSGYRDSRGYWVCS